MNTTITAFGAKEPKGKNILVEVQDHLSFLDKNINLMEYMLEEWENRNIDEDTLSIVMNEGFEKIKVFSDLIKETIALAEKDKLKEAI